MAVTEVVYIHPLQRQKNLLKQTMSQPSKASLIASAILCTRHTAVPFESCGITTNNTAGCWGASTITLSSWPINWIQNSFGCDSSRFKCRNLSFKSLWTSCIVLGGEAGAGVLSLLVSEMHKITIQTMITKKTKIYKTGAAPLWVCLGLSSRASVLIFFPGLPLMGVTGSFLNCFSGGRAHSGMQCDLQLPKDSLGDPCSDCDLGLKVGDQFSSYGSKVG